MDKPRLWRILKKGLWHCTSPSALRKIYEVGEIRPNLGDFPSTWPQSKISYAHHKQVISLFDFESAAEEDALKYLDNWLPHFTRYEPVTIAIGLNRSILIPDLIPNFYCLENGMNDDK